MIKIQTSGLTGPALDWAVAKCEAEAVGATLKLETFLHHHEIEFMSFSTDWSQGGPIIEREGIALSPDWSLDQWQGYQATQALSMYGPTPLIAAMRCYVVSKLGDEIEIPKELLK